jgi:hypothetical protein
MERRLIDANALLDAMRDEEFQTFVPLDEIDSVIDKAPTIDARPVVHGRWVHDINNLYGCSVCLGRENMSHKKPRRFCPDCGAKMDGGGRND